MSNHVTTDQYDGAGHSLLSTVIASAEIANLRTAKTPVGAIVMGAQRVITSVPRHTPTSSVSGMRTSVTVTVAAI